MAGSTFPFPMTRTPISTRRSSRRCAGGTPSKASSVSVRAVRAASTRRTPTSSRRTPASRRCAFRALIGVPVASPRAESCGLVLVFFVDPRPFSDEDIELARHLADAARGALERSELFEAERTQRSLSQQLARTGRTLATELDPAAVLDEVVQQAPALLAADAAAIRTLEDDDLVVSAAWGEGADAAVGARSAASAWLSGDVVQSRAPVAVDDASRDERLLAADAILASGYSAFLGVPLAGPDGTLHGVLAVYARKPRVWRPEEIDALHALAGNTAG